MAESLFLEIVTPQKVVVNEAVQSVVAPGSEGEFGVLRQHTSFLTSLKIGALRYKDTSGKEHYIFINGGFYGKGGHCLYSRLYYLSDYWSNLFCSYRWIIWWNRSFLTLLLTIRYIES